MAYKPRSLILDLFGDYLRYVDAEVRVGHLSSLLGDFDIAPATVRVTLSRLRREGWFTSRRIGRETVYTLSDSMLAVLEEGRQRIFAPPTVDWDGEWTLVIYQMSESDRVERNQLRKSLSWQGFGPLSTSTFIAPGDRRNEIERLVHATEDQQIDVLLCRSRDTHEDRALAGRCWDLAALADEYAAFIADHIDLVETAPLLRGADALVARTGLISTFRHFPFRDPRLPVHLRPAHWPGDSAHRLFKQTHQQLGAAARAHVSSVIGAPIAEAGPIGRLPDGVSAATANSTDATRSDPDDRHIPR